MTASFAVSGDTAVIEMAEAAGLRRLPGGRPAPLTATTYGVGELILAALDRGVRRVVLGVGGSATTDGGTGMARALGVRFLDADVRDLPRGAPPCACCTRSTWPASTRGWAASRSSWPVTSTTR